MSSDVLVAAVLLVLAGLLTGLDLGIPVVQPVAALALLFVVPTWLLFGRLRLLDDQPAARVLYALGLTVLGVTLLGLLLNTVLPGLGEPRPLQPRYVAPSVLLADLGLLVWPPRRARLSVSELVDRARELLVARFEPAQAIAVLALVLSVVGAIRLNNEAGSAVAVVALVCSLAAVVVLLVARAGSTARDVRVLVVVSLALLLATSLRGWTITGHDIQAEYLTFQLTDNLQHWDVSVWRNAYNACLSLNILPVLISQLSGLSGVVVFKVLAPALFATVPAMTYLLARRFLDRNLALVSALVFLAFPTFYTDMPYLVRQEVAFFFVGLLLLAGSAPAPQRPRLAFAGVFAVGVVVSHYSTTYLLVLGLGLGFAALVGSRLLARRRQRRGQHVSRPTGLPSALVVLNPLLIGMLLLGGLVWAGPVTGTGQHAREVTANALRSVFGQGEDSSGSSTLAFVPFLGGASTPQDRMDDYVEDTLQARAELPRSELLIEKPRRAELHPRIEKAGAAPATAVGSGLERMGVDADTVIGAVRLGSALAMQGLVLVGLVWTVRRRRAAGPARSDDPVDRVPEEALFCVLGVTAALGVLVLVPMLSVDYGVLRAFQQTLLVLAPVVAAGVWVLVRRLRARSVLVWALPVTLFLAFSGLVPALLGGHNGRLALGNHGLYFERYAAADSDLSAVHWLVKADKRQLEPAAVIANRNIGLRLLTEHPRASVVDRLYPTLLTRDSYVVVDARLAETGRSAVFHTGDVISYRYPLRHLDRRLDVVYSSAHTRIYR